MSHAPSFIRIMVVALATLAACQKAPEPPTPRATTQTLAVTTPPPAPAQPAQPAQPGGPAGMAPGNLPPGHPPINPPPPAPDGLPAGHPAVGDPAGGVPPAGGMGAPVDAETGVPLPLPLVGAGSVAELQGRLKAIADPATKAALEEAFRKTFTVDRQGRDRDRATALLEPLQASADPKVAALALRTLAYVAINNGFDTATAKDRYEKALALDADYGEAHYALAFVLAMSDRATGKVHFDRAMTLGVPDTRNLGGHFFGAATPPGHP